MTDLTIKEVAELLEVTPQAIYKVLNKDFKHLNNCLISVERNGKTLKALNSEGVEILRQHFKPTVETTDKQQFKAEFKTNDVIIELLSKQLDIKDKQIQDLSDRLREQQELNKNNQILIHRTQQQPKALPDGGTWEKIKNIFRK